MSSVKKLFSGLLAASISLVAIAPPILQPIQAQTQSSGQQELEKLLQQALQQTQQGKPTQAFTTYQQVLTLARQLQDKKNEAIALVGIGLNYDNIGQPQRALEFYNAALPISKEVGDRAGVANTLNNIGAVYNSIGQPQKALEFYNAALPISKEVGDRTGVANTLNNIGFVYRIIGQPQKALEFYNAALPIRKEVGDRAGVATTLNNIGFVYRIIGQPQKALEFYNAALPIRKEVGDRAGEATTLNNVGLVYDSIGQPQKALEFYNAALPILREVGDRAVEAKTLNNVGLVYDNIGQPQKALEFYNAALPISKEVGNRAGVAATLSNIGVIYQRIGQPQKALEFYNAALPIRKEVGDRAGEATTLNNVGLVYDSIGQQQKALEFYNAALPIRKEVGDRVGEATTLSNIGLVYRNIKRPTEAIKNFEQSVEITLQLRGGLERSNRQQFLASNQGTGVGLVELLIAQKQPERAYQWVNLTTSAELADYSRLVDAKVANSQAQRAIEEWNQSNLQLENLRQQLQQEFSPQLSAKINTLQAQINQRAETISHKFPEVAEIFETKPKDIAMLRANIPAGTVVIQPVLLTGVSNVPNTIALFVLTKDKLTVTQQKIDPKAFDELITQYRKELADGRFNKYRATSFKLYDILIRPVEAQIADDTKQLSIIATGKLRYIPFETLIDSKTNKYLIEKYPVNNLTRLSGRPLPSKKLKSTLLGLGNPFPKDGRSLQGAEDEVKSITSLSPGSEAHLGAEAKLDTFTTLAPRFPILHLATHGCFRPEGCPDLKLEANTILFSDRNLNIADAALLGLKNTDLVVLSACQTAVSASSNGEEFAGIAYLFERAGAKSVIASLWLAKDKETKDLMIAFYQNLKKGMTKGEALRSAKLSLIDKHPLYWSPFILIGDAR